MRKLLMLAALATFAFAGAAQAEIGWAGNAYPNHDATVTPTQDQFVVAQVWKEGVTDQEGQGADIGATLLYTLDGGVEMAVVMAYNTDIGANDEYIGYIPQADLAGASFVDVTVVFDDLADGTQFEITGDQNGNPPPLRYHIVEVTPVDVDVTFTMCMSGEPFEGPPCVIGNHPAIGEWGAGIMMNQIGDELFEVTVTFPAGSNPAIEYKYKKDVCNVWEDVGNRMFSLPTDGATSVVLDPDSWNNLPIGCGLGNTLDHMVEVCFQVCIEGVDNTGGVCVTGNLAELSGWGDGIAMTEIADDLYQACLYFEPGQPIPLEIQYKYKKDDCQTWESVDNRIFVLDNTAADEVTLNHAWDDGDSVCETVATEQESWSSVKGLFR
jgi:hypothetical protein